MAYRLVYTSTIFSFNCKHLRWPNKAQTAGTGIQPIFISQYDRTLHSSIDNCLCSFNKCISIFADRTLELSSNDYSYMDSANARSPLPADPTEGSSEPVQATQQASQPTQCTGTQLASSQETAVSRRALLQQTLSTELDSRLQALQDERCQRATEHKARMRMMEEEHGWKRQQYADEEKKRSYLHRMQLRLLRAKL